LSCVVAAGDNIAQKGKQPAVQDAFLVRQEFISDSKCETVQRRRATLEADRNRTKTGVYMRKCVTGEYDIKGFCVDRRRRGRYVEGRGCVDTNVEGRPFICVGHA
jgi:hypothetical protein